MLLAPAPPCYRLGLGDGGTEESREGMASMGTASVGPARLWRGFLSKVAAVARQQASSDGRTGRRKGDLVEDTGSVGASTLVVGSDRT